MAQPYNKINATTGDYRGAKAVLNERVVEGLQTYKLTTDLQLTYDTPKNVVIEASNGKSIILPDATTLINGWTVFFINKDTENSIEINYYSENKVYDLFATIESGKMVQCLLLNNGTSKGEWRLITTSEVGTASLENKYITNVFDTKEIDFYDLDIGTSKSIPLSTIVKDTALRSILIKPEVKFRGTEVYLDIGTESEPDKFYSGINLTTQEDYIKDLFEEILSTNTDTNVIATFYTKSSENSWKTTNTNTTNDIVNSFYFNSLYVLITDRNEILTSGTTSNFVNHTITDFNFNPNACFVENNVFYIAANKEGKFVIAKTLDFQTWEYYETTKEINYLPCYFVKCGKNYIVVSEGNIFSCQDLTDNSWTYTENDGILTVLKVSSSDKLCVISCLDSYFTTDNGIDLSQVSNDSAIYEFLDDKWIKYYKNSLNSDTIQYSLNFSDWTPKNTGILNIDSMHFLNKIWFVFSNIAQYGEGQLATSRDFFQTVNRIDIKFGNEQAYTVCGLPSKALVAGQEGVASYSEGNNFFDLYAGQVKIVVERVKEINPLAYNNVIINTNVPLGTIFNYPFDDVPDGYFRLCGEVLYNANTIIPDFIDKLNQAKSKGYTNLLITNEQYQTLSEEQKNNCGSFSWVDDNTKKDLRFPKISCFIRGIGDIDSLAVSTGTYTTDTMRSITGSATTVLMQKNNWQGTGAFAVNNNNGWQELIGEDRRDAWVTNLSLDSSRLGANYSGTETQPKHVKYPYIICIYQGTQTTATVNLESISNLLTKDQEYILEVREALQAVQASKSNNVRQCVTIAPNTNYVRSIGSLNITCDANVWGTCAQGFINGLPNDVIINNDRTLTLSLPANSSGAVFLQKNIATNEVTLGSTTSWVVSKTKVNTGVWYDIVNEKLFINGETPFYAVKIADYATSSTTITGLNIEPFRRPSIYKTLPDHNHGESRSANITYIANKNGWAYINVAIYASTQTFYLNGRAHTTFGGLTGSYAKAAYFTLYIPIIVGDSYKFDSPFTFYPCLGEIQ